MQFNTDARALMRTHTHLRRAIATAAIERNQTTSAAAFAAADAEDSHAEPAPSAAKEPHRLESEA
jgi:hypothetical protein